MIRNQCVNEGTAESGHEERNAELLAELLDGSGVDVTTYEAAPGRVPRKLGYSPQSPPGCAVRRGERQRVCLLPCRTV